MLKVGGFPEYLPWQQDIVDQVGSIIATSFSQYGYQHINTPAVERNDVITAKGGEETSKQIFGLYGLAQGSEDTKDYSLHFDLTIPFARYVLDYANELTFPFKRRQMQPVRRGERQQKGRFKEFVQADIDTIRQGDSVNEYLYYDAETIVVLYSTFTKILQCLAIPSALTVRFSNKKIISGLVAGLSADKQQEVISRVDKFYKMSESEFTTGLYERCEQDIAESIIKLLQLLDRGVAAVRGISDNPIFQQGLYELEKVYSRMSQISQAWKIPLSVKMDGAIVRGLDYYTGTVFETFVDDHISYGSVCSGGRYEHLTANIDEKKDYSGVGGSIGVDRFMSWLFDQGLVQPDAHGLERYLVLHFTETIGHVLSIGQQLRNEGHVVSIYAEPDKLKKQFSYADKAGFTYVIICGEEEAATGLYKIKNLKTGEEIDVSLTQ